MEQARLDQGVHLSAEKDSLSALLGERAERQNRDMMAAIIAAAIIGPAMAKSKIPEEETMDSYIEKLSRGAWVIAERVLVERESLIAQGKL